MNDPQRVFLDTSVLVRYFADDDPPRALAAARLVESDARLLVSSGALIELIHTLRSDYGIGNPVLAEGLITFLSRPNIELTDAHLDGVVAALRWSTRVSARRIPDAIISAAAERAGCDWIATFDERFTSPSVPVRAI